MHRSPSPVGPGKDRGLCSARRAGWAGALALLLGLGAPLPAAGQTAADTAAGSSATGSPLLDTPALESPPAAEPILEEQGGGGVSPWATWILLGGAVAAAAVGLVRRFRERSEPDPPEPLLVFAPPPVAPPALPHPAQAPPAPARPAERPASAAPPAPPPSPAPRDSTPRPEIEDELTVRLELPAEGRLQFLPGALEVVQGSDRQREIRFLRPAEGVPEYTLGRTGGPPQRHVQIPAPTVSRLHARMRFTEGTWTISNLSSTNPLRVNGRELGAPGESWALEDGDRIEMGEVVLRFRAPAR